MKYLLRFIKKINEIKYYIILGFVAFLIFVRFSFPDEYLVKVIIDVIYAQTGITVEAEGSSLSFLPSLGISLKSAKIGVPNKNERISIGKTNIKVSLISILFFSPKLRINSQSFDGVLEGDISGFVLQASGIPDDLKLNIKGTGLQLNKIIKIFLHADVYAKTNFLISGVLNSVNYSYSDLKIDAELSEIVVMDSNIMGFSIPGVTLKKGLLNARFVKSELLISKLSIGDPSSDIDLNVNGKYVLKFNNPYDLTVVLKLAGKLEQQFGQFLNIGPLAKTKRANGSFAFKIKGDSRVMMPFIESF